MRVHTLLITQAFVSLPTGMGWSFGSILGMKNADSTTGGVKKVLVTGAGGKTGQLVYKKLLGRQDFEPIGLVRSEKSAKQLRKMGGPKSSVVIGDVLDPQSLNQAMQEVDAVVLCTSAVPKILPLSLLKTLVAKLFRRPPSPPKFKWKGDLDPEQVDFVGTKNQVDAAKAAKVRRFVMVSSMGGTQPENFLNTIGREEDGTGGDILLWKRRGEKYLRDSGVPYTIIHPGGLLDKPDGKRELLLDVDDKLLAGKTRSVPRGDVAEVCVQSLVLDSAINRSFDLASRNEGEGPVTLDFKTLFARLKGNCDYSLGPK